MPLNAYVTLGRTGLRVSPLSLGAMTFGQGAGWSADQAESGAMLRCFVDRGGNFIDTADIYNKGRSEEIIGEWLDGPAQRHQMVISTKFGGNMVAGDPNGGGASAKTMIRACEDSLRRLKTDYIDVYWCHLYDHLTPIEETLRTFDRLVSSGKVRYVGVSNFPAWRVAQAQTIADLRGWTPLAAITIEYSLLERTVEAEHMPMARELGLAVIPWSPLRGGILSGKFTRETAGQSGVVGARRTGVVLDERDYIIIDELADLAERHGTSVGAVALAWVRQRPGVTSTLVGARSVAQLEANLRSLDVSLSGEEIERLDMLSKPPPTFNSDRAPVSFAILQNGLTVNGVTAGRWPPAKSD